MNTQELAAKLSVEIFDRIERDGRLIRQTIEEIISDGVLLHQAKQQPQSIPANDGELEAAAAALIHLFEADPRLLSPFPAHVVSALSRVKQALPKTAPQHRRRSGAQVSPHWLGTP